MGHTNYLGFSASLMTKLTDCRGTVESWVEREKRTADATEEKYQQVLAKEQAAVTSLEDNLLNIRFKLGINIQESARVRGSGGIGDGASSPTFGGIAQRQQGLIQEKARLQLEIAALKVDWEGKSKNIKELKEEEDREQARAAEVRSKKRLAEESKNTTVDDLTRGIINYKYLGLDFVKAENQTLRFSFSQIDPAEPSKAYSFVLSAQNEMDEYDVDDCGPAVDPGFLERALYELNAEEDLGQFVMTMRAAFVDLV